MAGGGAAAVLPPTVTTACDRSETGPLCGPPKSWNVSCTRANWSVPWHTARVAWPPFTCASSRNPIHTSQIPAVGERREQRRIEPRRLQHQDLAAEQVDGEAGHQHDVAEVGITFAVELYEG